MRNHYHLLDGRLEPVAQRSARESGSGVVATGGDDCFLAVGERATGDGAFYANDARVEPEEAWWRAEAGATSAQTGEVGMKGKPDEEAMWNNYEADPHNDLRICYALPPISQVRGTVGLE